MIQVASLNLRNPYLNASGIYSQIPELYKFWQPLGVGALVTKTITFDERMGYKGRRMVINKEKGYMINRMGLPNPGLQKTIELLKEYKSKFKTPLIVSILADREKELALLGLYADAIELNVSCPNEEKNVPNIGYSLDLLKQVCENVMAKTDKPIIVKLPPYIGKKEAELLKLLENEGIYLRFPIHESYELKEIIKMLDKINISGVTMSNTIAVRQINLETKEVIIQGGLSATLINKQIVLKNIQAAKEVSDIDIIASGGVLIKKDADNYLSAGAKAVQLGSGVYLKQGNPQENLKEFVKQFIYEKN